jgi:hypothetical protein
VTWRDHARPIIARVLSATSGLPEKDIRKALRDAYPYGERAMHPYKIWCDEIRRQRGLKTPRAARTTGVVDPKQVALFQEKA